MAAYSDSYGSVYGVGFAESDSDDPVEMVYDILSATPSDWFTLTTPEVYRMWDVDPQQRLKNPNPAVYVWSPTPGTIGRFSADGDLLDDQRSVECLIMTYDKAETHRYTEDIIRIIARFVDDNANTTVFEDVDPTNVEDLRGDKIRGRSDHYINTIELETRRLRDSGRA